MTQTNDAAPPVGASAAEWDFFVHQFGGRLVPIAGTGKAPSYFNPDAPDAPAHGLIGWHKRDNTPAEVAYWRRDPRHGIGVRCGGTEDRCLVAIDADTDTSEQRAAVLAVARDVIGETPMRYRDNSSRFALLVWVTDHLYRKRTVLLPDKQKVELLAQGQQLVVAGTHESGARIRWTWAPIPEVTEEIMDRFYDRLLSLPGASAGKDRNTGRGVGDRIEVGIDPIARWLDEGGRVLGGKPEGVYVECPWKSQHSKDSGITEAIWFHPTTEYPGGQFHCQHESCAGKGRDAFLAEIGYWTFPDVTPTAQVIPIRPGLPVAARVEPVAATLPARRYDRTEEGRIRAHAGNVGTALFDMERLGYRFRVDRFTGRREVSERNGPWQQISDIFLARLARQLCDIGFVRDPGRDTLYAQVALACEAASYSSVGRWLFDLEWDGIPRLDRWLADCLGLDRSAYVDLVGREMIRAICLRALSAGTPSAVPPWPYIVLLIGRQGLGKSTLAREIGNGYFGEIDLSLPDRELAQAMQGKLVVEISELVGLDKRERGRLKHFVSRTTEEHRMAYDRDVSTLVRTAIMVGTTNDEEPLPADSGGQRRWLPVHMDRPLNVEGFRAVRDQLFAEAMTLLSEPLRYADLERLGASEAEREVEIDPWSEVLEAYLDDHQEITFATTAALLSVVGGALTSGNSRRLKLCMLRVGSFVYSRKRVDGEKERGYRRRAR
jgi:hypothetical protein